MFQYLCRTTRELGFPRKIAGVYWKSEKGFLIKEREVREIRSSDYESATLTI